MAMHSSGKLRKRYDTYSQREYQEQLQRIVKRIHVILSPSPLQYQIKYRVKAFENYHKKWTALGQNEDVGIGDMLGVRIICPFLDDLYVVERAIQKQFCIEEVDRKEDKRSFREFGYDSIHLLLDLKGEIINHPLPGVEPVCEIQLRTVLQDAWAEVEHELIYKSEWSIPTDQIKRKLAALNANLSLSDIIFQELRDFQKEVQRKQEKRREIQNTRIGLVTSDVLSKKLGDGTTSHGEKKDLEKLILKALTAHSEESFSRAIRLYSRALRLSSTDPIRSILLNHRGMAYFAIGETNAARADFKAALSLDEGNFRAWYNLGLTHKALGDEGWALEAFTMSCKLEPSFFDSQVHRIRLLLELGDTESAAKAVGDLRGTHSDRSEISALEEALRNAIKEK